MVSDLVQEGPGGFGFLVFHRQPPHLGLSWNDLATNVVNVRQKYSSGCYRLVPGGLDGNDFQPRPFDDEELTRKAQHRRVNVDESVPPLLTEGQEKLPVFCLRHSRINVSY